MIKTRNAVTSKILYSQGFTTHSHQGIFCNEALTMELIVKINKHATEKSDNSIKSYYQGIISIVAEFEWFHCVATEFMRKTTDFLPSDIRYLSRTRWLVR